MRSIQFIYFDIGGVLVDYAKAFATAASKFNLEIEDIGKVFDENVERYTKGYLSAQDLWDTCIQKYNLKNVQSFDFLDSWVSDYQPIQVMHDLIQKLQFKFKIGLLSNIYKGMLPLLLEKNLIPNIHYEQIIFSCDVGMLKPFPDIYSLAQKKAKVNPINILLVDDKEKNLVTAKKAKWNTFFFDTTNRDHSVKELKKYLEGFLKKY